MRAALRAEVPDGVTVHLTGRDPLYEDVGGSDGPSLLVEILIGGIGALLVLLFVFGTLPAVVVPLLVAASLDPHDVQPASGRSPTSPTSRSSSSTSSRSSASAWRSTTRC